MSPTPVISLADLVQRGLFPPPNRTDAIVQDFCYSWDGVRVGAEARGQNLDQLHRDATREVGTQLFVQHGRAGNSSRLPTVAGLLSSLGLIGWIQART